MGRRVDIADLIDAVEVARLAGFKSPTAVSVYLSRGVLPEPVIDRGSNRARLWLRQDIERWIRKRESS
jgi:predicted DNA-binding transcriptional regulator AlpA